MTRLECCRETETAVFGARTNLPVSDFQTWHVWWKCNFLNVLRFLRNEDSLSDDF